MMSDFQESLETGERTFADEDRLVESVQPDIVALGGDQIDHNLVKSYEETEKFLERLVEPMEKRNIPWIHVLGNHDHDTGLCREDLISLYEKFPHCMSSHEDGLHGVSNYVLPVYGSDGMQIKFCLWGLDSHTCMNDVPPFSKLNPYNLEKRPPMMGTFGLIYFDQLLWYYNHSLELEKKTGSPVPGIMFVHVAPWEANFALSCPHDVHAEGFTDEDLNLTILNSGLFSLAVQRGDIKCIASGHSHNDTFSSELLGIKIVLDGSAGYSAYGLHERKGGRVFEIDETCPEKVITYMKYYREI